MGTKVPQGLHLKPPWNPQSTVREILLPLLLWYGSVHRLHSPRTDLIRKGLTWKWVNKPPALSWPPPSTCRGTLTHHISRLLAEGIIAEVPLQRCYPSHLFTVPKTSNSGGERVVIDLSSLNFHIACPTFKMCTVSKVRNSVPKGAYFTSIDISDAFHHIPIHARFQKYLAFAHIPIHARFQKYLAFAHEGRIFFFQTMPFGINIGPRIFSLVATEAVKHLHNKGISASVYIDDWLLWDRSPKNPQTPHIGQGQPSSEVGLHTQPDEVTTEAIPDHHLPGHLMVRHRPHPPPGQQSSGEGLHDGPGSPAAALSPLEALPEAPGLYQLRGTIHRVRAPTPQADHSDLPQLQGQEIPPTIAAVSATPPMVDPETELGSPCSDVHPASRHHNLDRRLKNRVGVGVSSLGSTVSGVWSHEESLFHINTLECLAVTRSLLKLYPPKDSFILVRTDNTVVVSLINKQGSNKSMVLSRFLHELLALCARNRWTIRSRHLPGHLNTWADSLSRSHPVQAEWSLSPQSFQQLTTHLSPEIDLFAHPGNAKLPAFGCPFPFPQPQW